MQEITKTLRELGINLRDLTLSEGELQGLIGALEQHETALEEVRHIVKTLRKQLEEDLDVYQPDTLADV